MAVVRVVGRGEARSRIYWSAEPSNTEIGGALQEHVTERVSRVLVFADLDHGTIRLLTPKCQEQWRVSISELDMAAGENLDRLLQGKQLDVARGNGYALGMVPVDSEAEALKASIIFAPGLKAFVEAEIGWPVLAVIPCRDFIYLFGEGDDASSVLGSVVPEGVQEFRVSDHDRGAPYLGRRHRGDRTLPRVKLVPWIDAGARLSSAQL